MPNARTAARTCALLARTLLAAALLAGLARPASAADDDDPPGRAARLGWLRGDVSLQPAGESEWAQATANRPLTTGDRLWLDTGARAELDTGSAAIRLGASTDFSFANLDDRITQLELVEGTLTVRVSRLGPGDLIEVDTPTLAFSILAPGSYRVEAGEDGATTLVTIRDGAGEVSGGGRAWPLRAGQSTRFTGAASLLATTLPAGVPDELDEWGQERDRRADESAAGRYVSHDVAGYEDLDGHGIWRADPSYGSVWIPSGMPDRWAPYHDGHWAWIAPWGYTWIDDASWGYAPFHYGRWATIDASWCWVPGPATVRAVYVPALVVFIGGGDAGEVAWFPLGPREVYVPGHRASRGYVERVNRSNTTVDDAAIAAALESQKVDEYRTARVVYVNRAARGGVTAVPRQAFASAQPVARAAVAASRERMASGPIGPSAGAAPTHSSVFGAPGARTDGAHRPPAAVAARSVVAKAPPPLPAVPFARQEPALGTHPGQPLARRDLEGLRPTVLPPKPTARPLPPGRPTAGDVRAPPAAPDAPGRAVRPADRRPAAPPPPPRRPQDGEGVRPPIAEPPIAPAPRPRAPAPPPPAARPVAPATPAQPAATPPARPQPMGEQEPRERKQPPAEERERPPR